MIEIIINVSVILALPASFKYLCYGSTAIINILTCVFTRQILTSKIGPRAERVIEICHRVGDSAMS